MTETAPAGIWRLLQPASDTQARVSATGAGLLKLHPPNSCLMPSTFWEGGWHDKYQTGARDLKQSVA